MVDNIHTAKHADILVLGDFNIDLLKPHSSSDSTITLLGLNQFVKSPTRITQTFATLMNNNNNIHLSCAHQRPERSHDTY